MGGTTRKKKETRESIHVALLILFTLLFFLGVGHRGYILEADSYNYMECNFGREPLYPIFLLIFRELLGKGVYLQAVWLAQTVLAGICVIYCALWLKRCFSMKNGMLYVIYFLLLMPYWFSNVWYGPGGGVDRPYFNRRFISFHLLSVLRIRNENDLLQKAA